MPTNFDFKRSSVSGSGGAGEALAMGRGGVIWREGKPYQRPEISGEESILAIPE
jgi:hypothetical protein